MDVWETEAHPFLIPEKVAIRQWVRTLDRPMLNICLGHQLLADGVSNINLSDIGEMHPLLDGFKKSKKAINFHVCEVTRLPTDGIRLART
jgi:GMP synthase-like glutamine amidotransferase